MFGDFICQDINWDTLDCKKDLNIFLKQIFLKTTLNIMMVQGSSDMVYFQDLTSSLQKQWIYIENYDIYILYLKVIT